MSLTETQIDEWLYSKEDEHLEFKEAKNRFDFEELVRYCAALSNEGGGRIIFGATNKIPKKIVGTKAFENLERTKSGLIERLHIRIDAEAVQHLNGRVLVVTAPRVPSECQFNTKALIGCAAGKAWFQ